MELLPDDILVMVMSHLSVPDLMHLRLVCKRLAPLALHGDVWRHRCLEINQHWTCQPLHLAPCLAFLDVTLPSDSNKCDQLFTARCAIRKLRIHVKDLAGAELAARFIRHQKDLGRLREILLYFNPCSYDVWIKQVSVLFSTLLSTPDLDVLTIYAPPIYGGFTRSGFLDELAQLARSLDQAAAVPASLTQITCLVVPPMQAFFDVLLSRNARTLKTLVIVPRTCTSLLSSTARLLGGMPNLAALECPLLPGMDAVAACEALRDVRLYLSETSPHANVLPVTPRSGHQNPTVEFFRRATQLTHVFLFDSCTSTSSRDLVSALAWSGRSRVEFLHVEVAALDKLRSLLPSLPSLCHLNLSSPARVVSLEAVIAARRARARARESVQSVCPIEQGVQDLQRANGSLRVTRDMIYDNLPKFGALA